MRAENPAASVAPVKDVPQSADQIGRLSIILPAYNEERAILATLRETVQALDGLDFEVIVVDDGSHDATHSEVLRAASADDRVRAVRYDLNAGKGHALKYGFGHVRPDADWVAFVDADLDLHPSQLRTLIDVQRQSGADVVIGSKRHPASKLDYPWRRRLVSVVYFWLVRLLFGLPIHDTQTGMKLFRQDVLAAAMPRLLVKRFAFDLELLEVAHRLGFRIAEAPVELRFGRGHWGRISLRAIWTTLVDTLAIFYRARIVRQYD